MKKIRKSRLIEGGRMEAIEVKGKTVDEALTNALLQLETTSDKIDYEIIDKGSSGFLGIGSKPVIIRVKKRAVTVEEIITEFLTKVCNAMDIAVKVEIQIEDSTININLIGDNMGILIGKRGQTLDSLQYLVSLVVNREAEAFYRIKLDTENYRARRRETLENLAKNLANKVKKTKRPVELEPMNPYERRIIHSTLQNDKMIKTTSQGEDPNRYVVISLK